MGHTPGVSCRQKIAALIAYDLDQDGGYF
jgi:hypothetical protein